ncbi:MAG: type VI secretion system accessory protein TagJ [Desulfococcaceae bacterium]
MTPRECIQSGNLDEARKQLTQAVKSRPGDAGARSLLARVLLFLGEWDKADRHLDMAATQNPAAAESLLACRGLIQAEKERAAVLAGSERPGFLSSDTGFAEVLLGVLQALQSGDADAAAARLAEVDERRPPLSGTVNGTEFSGFRDTDDRLRHVLEAFVHGRYVWAPFYAIRELRMEPPANLLDLLWAPAALTTWEGLTLNCFLPVGYPETTASGEPDHRLARRTEWSELGAGLVKGLGPHVYEIGGADVGLLDIRELNVTPFGAPENDAATEARNDG